MKKILFLLLMLCGMTMSWAGTGNGSKDNPYTGDWTINELSSVLKKGDRLGYNCVIKGEDGSVRVYDTKISLKYAIITSWKEWAVGAPISGESFKEYAEYRIWTDPNELMNQTFIVTSFERSNLDAKELVIKGYYSGFYTEHEAEGYITVATASELKSAIQNNNAARVLLTADIDISGMGTICEKFTGVISGYHKEYEKGALQSRSYIIQGSGYVKDLTKNDAKDTYMFESVEGATFEYLSFHDISVEKSSDDIGVIALTATNTTFRSIVMDQVSVYDGDDNAGTFVGTANGCHFIGVFVNYSEVYTGGYNSGGLVGKSDSSEYTNCTVFINCGVYADGTVMTGVNARAGGIVGESTNDNFTKCANYALVGGLCDGLGGIAGYSDGSNFLSCKNYGNVCHCEYTGEGKKMFFRKSVDEIRERLKNIRDEDVEEILDAVEAGCYTALEVVAAASIINGLVILATGESAKFELIKTLADIYWEFDEWSWMGTDVAIAEFFGVFIVAFAITGAIIYDIVTDYDNLGGICGEARYSSFEMCSNYADLRNDDEGGGGIVGDGSYVVINNCFNSGYVYNDGSSLNGSIIGTINHGKVSNCVSVAENSQPIIGGAWGSHHDWIDQTSGNNYRLKGGSSSDEPDLERVVNKDLLEFGIVANWLNNGVENREKGIRPWHQNIYVHEGFNGKEIKRDFYPVLNAMHDEVNADLFYGAKLSPYVHFISDAEGLKAFANVINNGNSENNGQFHIGYLENDINMEGEDWTPIGKDEDFKNFRGIFNGRGHKITGLTYSSTNQPVGLFGTVYANAEICNVTVGEGSSFTCNGDAGAGGIVGKVNIGDRKWGTAVIENCGSRADINVNKHGGGILGRIEASGNENIKVYVNNCYSTGTITAENGNSALLCGYTQHSGNIRNCWSSGQLRNGSNKSIWPYSIENDDDNTVAECLVGYSNNTINIKDCYIVNLEDRVDKYLEYKNQYPLQAGVKTMSAAEVAMGQLAYDMNKICGKTIWEQNLGKEEVPGLGTDSIYHARTISDSSKGYGTICVPFAMESNDEISYYRFVESKDENGDKVLHFAYTPNVMAGEPVLFRTSKTGELAFRSVGDMWENMPSFSSDVNHSDWRLDGTYEQKVFEGEDAEYIYYVSNGEIRNAKKTTVAPFRAYIVGDNINNLTGNGAGYAKAIRFVLEDEYGDITALELVGNDLKPVQNGNTFSLMGTRVSDSYRGIVIKNGRKVIQK